MLLSLVHHLMRCLFGLVADYHGPLRTDGAGVTDRVHRLSGSRAPVSAQPLDH